MTDGAQVAELIGLLDLDGWPAGMRVIVRRERPHPGAQLSLFEERDGWRYTAFVTNTQVGALQWLEARHAPTPAWKTASAAPRTPDCDGYRPASSPSTKRGAPPQPSPPTSSPGYNSSPSTATSPGPSPNGCATGSWPWATQITAAFNRIAAIPAPG
jgi:hypothetical protein